MLYSSLASGATYYDVIIPSDYIIDRLVKEGRLMELDHSQLTNYKYIDEKYQNLYFDPDNKYSVPYNVGMVGLIYNSKLMDESPTGWSSMWDEQYKGEILMFNNPRDAFGIAQLYLGQSINTKSVDDWNKAIDALKVQNHLVSSYVMDEVFNKMERGDAALAPYYAGDFLTMYDVNPDLAFVYPKEGVNFFVDAMCIPKNAQNKEAAELYINFMLEEDIAVANANYICYASPHKLVLESDDYDLKGDPVLYPAEEDMPKTEMFENLDYETQNYMTMLWNELKIEGNSNMDAYIGLSITAVLIVAYATYSFIKKKRREAMY
jgi:spermidine/putrescine transport system substrate-binding protein